MIYVHTYVLYSGKGVAGPFPDTMVGGEGEDRCGGNSGPQSFEGMLVCQAPDPGLGLSG